MKTLLPFLLIINLVTALFSSCDENMPIDPCEIKPCDTVVIKPPIKDSNIVWQYNADTINNSCVSILPVHYENTILFTNGTRNLGEPFVFFNKKTGEIINQAIDPENTDGISAGIYQYKNYAVITDWYKIYVFDLKQNMLLKTFNLRDFGYEGLPRIGGLGEYVFIPVEKIGATKQEYANTWLRWNVLTDQMDEILTVEDQGTFVAGFESLAFWFKPNGDTVMIFQNRQYDFINRNRRIDMYAYNMSQKKYEWKIDSFTRTGNTSVFPILVKEDRLYFQGSNEAFCFSCLDGHQIWNRYFPGEGFFRTNAVLAEGKYILKGESKTMYALDENTGLSAWENLSAGTSSSNMLYHAGRVFYETGQDGLGVLRGLRVSTGKVEWTYFSSNYPKYSNVSFELSGIAIDSETNYIYANDRVFHMCIKLPK
ncbi:MAG: PQQ-like beta-propeller repeat protein [Saprospiraceae bacterium]|nr:PQQ-like beta-propeller repeat protein [Saprospiraceae bacterium]